MLRIPIIRKVSKTFVTGINNNLYNNQILQDITKKNFASIYTADVIENKKSKYIFNFLNSNFFKSTKIFSGKF